MTGSMEDNQFIVLTWQWMEIPCLHGLLVTVTQAFVDAATDAMTTRARFLQHNMVRRKTLGTCQLVEDSQQNSEFRGDPNYD